MSRGKRVTHTAQAIKALVFPQGLLIGVMKKDSLPHQDLAVCENN